MMKQHKDVGTVHEDLKPTKKLEHRSMSFVNAATKLDWPFYY